MHTAFLIDSAEFVFCPAKHFLPRSLSWEKIAHQLNTSVPECDWVAGNGYEICRDLRREKNSIPVLMLTTKGQETDKVIGLELGADDYVTKPFGLRELLARVHALRGKRAGISFELTPREMSVLAILHQERGNVVSRDRILNEVWGIDYYGTTRTLDQVIVKIRQKLESEPSHPRHLLTVHGLGYRFDP
jgi:DNA-binding response OmpR family regulator